MKFCWLHQKIISSRLDEGAALPGRVQGHLQSCPHCRQVYESEIAAIRTLSADAPERHRRPSPFLHRKIMSAIQLEREQPLPRRPSFARWALPVVAATACAIFAGIYWLRPPVAPVGNAAAPEPALTKLALNVNLPSEAQMNQWSAALDAPLEGETQLVLNDAKAAVDSLKNSFLPSLAPGPRHGRN